MRAILLGGTGAMGGATAQRLALAGWDVEVTGRQRSGMPDELLRAGVRFHRLDRADTRGVARLIGGGADLIVDLVAYKAADVRALLPAMASAASLVLVSSRAVYVDDAGRHINGDEPPRFRRPAREDSGTVPPAADDVDPFTREGYAPCKVAAERVALDSGLPVTVLRPSKVHGRWARNARTKDLVGQMLAGEQTVALADADAVDHLTAAANVAALIETVAAHPGRRILNSADPDTPTAEEIVRAIAGELQWHGTIEHVPGGSGRGHHPWRTSLTLDTTAARDVGYQPVGNALDLLIDEVRWVRGGRSPAAG